MTNFPVLDASYAEANTELFRTVLENLGVIEPRIDETDSWCAVPLRIVHDAASGVHLELGPYALDPADIERLRAAIERYDAVTGAADFAGGPA